MGREDYLVCQLKLLEKGPGIDTPGWGGSQPGVVPYVNHNLCKVGVSRGQPGHSPYGLPGMFPLQTWTSVKN